MPAPPNPKFPSRRCKFLELARRASPRCTDSWRFPVPNGSWTAHRIRVRAQISTVKSCRAERKRRAERLHPSTTAKSRTAPNFCVIAQIFLHSFAPYLEVVFGACCCVGSRASQRSWPGQASSASSSRLRERAELLAAKTQRTCRASVRPALSRSDPAREADDRLINSLVRALFDY